MPDTAYDCVVIGSGPGGYVAAIRAAQLEMRTAVVEKDAIGGRCLNYACIPAKAVLRSADVLTEIDDAAEFGLRVAGREVDFPGVAARRDKVIKTLTSGVGGLFKKNQIDYLEGVGALDGDGKVLVGGDTIDARVVVLATGSIPRPIPGVEFGGRVVDTAGAWLLDGLPASMAVVGAGASGAEIASGFARLGTQVTLFEALPRVLPTEDEDISKAVERGLRKQGMEIRTDTTIADVDPAEDRVRFSAAGEQLEAEYLVIATGRGPDLEGLEEAGVELDELGLVKVDGAQRTSREGVYAIGDLVAGPALAHKASEEGIVAVEDAAGRPTQAMEHLDIPRATFCTPNVASFGLTEAQARDAGYEVTVSKVQYGAVGGGTVYGDRSGVIKIVGETRYGELLGGHICGAKATELIQELVNAKLLEGGYPEVARIVHGHPTLSEAVMEAARAADGWLIHG